MYVYFLADIGVYVPFTYFAYLNAATYFSGDFIYFGPSLTKFTGFTGVYPTFFY